MVVNIFGGGFGGQLGFGGGGLWIPTFVGMTGEGVLDSRFHGNDGGEGGNDIKGWGFWIPTFVGMTVGGAGMAVGRKG